ncbi:MAG: DUF1330 domain-containing protein [Burkholderiaceae bacterium]
MTVYMVVELEVTDPEAYARYQPEARAALARLGGRGRVIIRGGKDGSGKTETLEGDWMPERFVVVEFPDKSAAESFYYSTEYQEVLQLRLSASRSKAFFVEGE